jgi:hypothetical protein
VSDTLKPYNPLHGGPGSTEEMRDLLVYRARAADSPRATGLLRSTELPKWVGDVVADLRAAERELAAIKAVIDRYEQPSVPWSLSQHTDGILKRQERANKALRAELDEVRRTGTPGVMHEVDKAFYDLAIKERNAAQAKLAAVLSGDHSLCCRECREERDRLREQLKAAGPRWYVGSPSGLWSVCSKCGTAHLADDHRLKGEHERGCWTAGAEAKRGD